MKLLQNIDPRGIFLILHYLSLYISIILISPMDTKTFYHDKTKRRRISYSDPPSLSSSFTTGAFPNSKEFDELYELGQQNRVTLHEFEEKNIVMDAPISSITWFSGDVQSAASLIRSRVKAIAAKNPWICGRLQREYCGDNTSPMQLVYKETSGGEMNIEDLFIFHSIHDLYKSHDFCLGLNLQETTMLAKKYEYIVKPAKELVDFDEPIFKVAVIPDSSQPNQFALTVSLSHRVGDGFTFYALYNMIGGDPIVSLNPERNLDVVKSIEERMGKKMLEGINGLWVKLLFVRDILWSKVKGAKWGQKIFLLNEEYVKSVKEDESALEVCGRIPSTNDIIVSTCFKVAKPDVGLMCINFRGRIENCGEFDAPNYFNTIIYRPRDYDSPSLIRKSITGGRFERAGTPPTVLIASTPMLLMGNCHVSICTNWSTFYSDNFTLGPDIKHILHLPLKDMQYAAPSLMSNFTIFKPCPGKIAICVTGTPEMVESMSRSHLVGP